MPCLAESAPTDCTGRHVRSSGESEVRRYLWLTGLTGLLWMGCEGAARCGLGKSPLGLVHDHAATSSWCLSAIASAALFFASARPSSRSLILLLALALGLAVGLTACARTAGGELTLPAAVSIGLGVAGLGMLAYRASTRTGAARRESLALLLPACLVPTFNALNMYFLLLTIEVCRSTFDARLYAADECFGFQPSFLAGQLLVAVPLLRYTAMMVYNTLPMAFLALFLLQLRAGRARLPNGNVFWPFIGAGLVGFWLYLLIPAAGPASVFRATFPESPPDVNEVKSETLPIPDTVRNCMPSLHTTWALLLFWHARPFGRRLRLVAGSYLVFTLLAALGYGEHYLFDLVVAFPFALAVHAACSPAAGRSKVVAFGVTLAAGWLLVLVFALPALAFSIVLTWSAVLATGIGCLLLEGRLYRRAAVILGPNVVEQADEVSRKGVAPRPVRDKVSYQC